jgi:hypothetical protein
LYQVGEKEKIKKEKTIMDNKTFTLINDVEDGYYGDYICGRFIWEFLNKRPDEIKVTLSDQPQEGFTKATIYRDLSGYIMIGVIVNDKKHPTLDKLDNLIIKTFGEDVTHFYFKIEEVS